MRVAPGDVATEDDGRISADQFCALPLDFEKVPEQVDYVALSPVQVISVAAS